jgi:hypothetical protein
MIGNILDPYDRKARLYPALLVLFVPVISISLVAPVFSNQLFGFASIAVGLGALMMMSSLGRECGKRMEPKLFQKWGGAPTTLMLLHQTTNLDQITLNRYKNFLETNIPGLNFLDKDIEIIDRQGATAVCESAVKWLREATRDSKKHSLIFAENVNYGFRRNLLGVKPLGLTICIFTLAITTFQAWLVSNNLSAISNQYWGAIIVAFIGIIFWSVVVNAEFVKTTAFAYATALLAACDSPNITKEKPKVRKASATSKS